MNLAEIPKMTLLFLKQSDTYVVQCLEYDIAAQGSTQADALASFAKVAGIHMQLDLEQGKFPLSDIEPAPREYQAFDL